MTSIDTTVTTIAKKPLVIYHANCADGFGAAWCFYQAGQYEFHAGQYGDELPDCADRDVYMVDFSYKKDVVKEICKVANMVYWIDHHHSAMVDLAPLCDHTSEEWVKNLVPFTSSSQSGAVLAWRFLYGDDADHRPLPLLLCYIQDRDLWKFELEGTKEIMAALFSYDFSFYAWTEIIRKGAEGIANLRKEGASLLRKHDRDVRQLLKSVERHVVIGGYCVPTANVPYAMSSDAGHIMADKYASDCTFAACYSDTATHRIFSLRSIESGMDVSAIAAMYGGGGHIRAAGFKVPRSHILATA